MTGEAVTDATPPTAADLKRAWDVYRESMWSSPDTSACSCRCHGQSEANIEHHVTAIAAALAQAREDGASVAARHFCGLADQAKQDGYRAGIETAAKQLETHIHEDAPRRKWRMTPMVKYAAEIRALAEKGEK